MYHSCFYFFGQKEGKRKYQKERKHKKESVSKKMIERERVKILGCMTGRKRGREERRGREEGRERERKIFDDSIKSVGERELTG